MPQKLIEAPRDQKSFDAWWSQRLFFTTDPLHKIYKNLYLKGADLDFIDCLTLCLLFADSLNGWRPEVGAQRRGQRIPTKQFEKIDRALTVLTRAILSFGTLQGQARPKIGVSDNLVNELAKEQEGETGR